VTGVGGVVVRARWLTSKAAIPYVDRSRDGMGDWLTNGVGKKCAVFLTVFWTGFVFGLSLFDVFIMIDRRAIDPAANQRVGDAWPGYTIFAGQHFPGGAELVPNYVIPIAVMLILPVVLVPLRKRLFGAGTREWMSAIFTAFLA